MDLTPYMPPAWVVWTIAGLVSVVVTWYTVRAALDGIRYAARSAQAWRRNRTTTDRRPAELEDILTWVMAGIATSVSASGMWKFAGDVLQLDGFWRVLFFAFIEGAIVISALRARRSMRENYTAGLDGIAVWALAALTAVLASIDAKSAGEMVFRLAAPMVAAWLWERGMRLERRKLRGLSGINWRLTPERILVRLGLAEATNRTAGDVDRQRWITRIGLAAKKAKELRDAGASGRKQRAALARLDKAFEQAAKQVGLGHDEQVQKEVRTEVAALYSVASLMDIPADSAWDPAPVAGPEHVCPVPEVVKVPVTIRRVVEKPVETVVEKPVVVERVVEVPVPVTVEKPIEVPTPVVAVDALDAARIAYEHSLTGPGRPLGQRTLARRFGIEHRAAEEIIKTSQGLATDEPAEAPETASAVTGSEPAQVSVQDRHSATRDEAPTNPDDALTEWLLATDGGSRQEAADDRHSRTPGASDDEYADAIEIALRPAAVTINADSETPAGDRHSTTSETRVEEGHGAAPDVPPVTLSDEAGDTPAAPSQRIAFTPLTPVFREPSTGQPVTVPEASTRPSRDDSMNAFDRAVAAAAAEHHRLPALNGTHPTDSTPA